MPKKRTHRKDARHMSDNHDHPQGPPVQPQRQASPYSVIAMQKQRLDEKAQHIRRLEDGEVQLAALVHDLLAEVDSLNVRLAELQPTAELPDATEAAAATARD